MSTDIAPPLRVMQFICPTGYYGAERWVTALANNTNPLMVTQSLVVTEEPGVQDLELCRVFSSYGLDVHRIQMGHKFDLRAIFRLKRLLISERVDVLHTHGYKSDLIGVAAAKLAGVKCVCTPHGFENTTDLKLRTFIALGNRSFRYFDRVAPLSKTLCQDVARTGVKENKITYIANGVDLKSIERMRVIKSPTIPQGSLEKDNELLKLGFIGQLISRKNVEDLIDVFSALSVDNKQLRLVLVGDGDRREALERRATSLGCSDKVEFRGFVADAIPFYFDFDAFVMTSSLEGIPRCLMEAMTAGVPIVAYDIAGVDQLIQHDNTGLLAPFGDKHELKKLCERVLYESSTGSRLAGAARSYVVEHHSAGRMAREYEALYQEFFTG